MIDTIRCRIFVVALVGWANRHQLEVIDFLREENFVDRLSQRKGPAPTAVSQENVLKAIPPMSELAAAIQSPAVPTLVPSANADAVASPVHESVPSPGDESAPREDAYPKPITASAELGTDPPAIDPLILNVPAAPAGTKPRRPGGAIAMPLRTKTVPPIYPVSARESGVQGVVIVEVTVTRDGKVDSARILRSIPVLDQAALDAVQQWEFAPTVVEARRIPILMAVGVPFSLQ